MAHVLVPTDFSDNALNAAVYAVRLYGDEGNVFTVLNSHMLPRSTASTMWNIDELLAKESLEGVTAFAGKLRGELPDLKPVTVPRSEHGDLPHVVARLKEEEEPAPDLVVMGTQGATGLKEVLMGSNTADVIKRGVLPVLAVPENARYKAPRRILLADDGGPVDGDTVKALLDIARRSQAEVMIVRVVNEDTTAGSGTTSSAYDALLGTVPHSHHYVSGGNIATALHGIAEKGDADLVVVTHRQRGLFERILHRSTATRLAMHTHVPMLVLQQPAG